MRESLSVVHHLNGKNDEAWTRLNRSRTLFRFSMQLYKPSTHFLLGPPCAAFPCLLSGSVVGSIAAGTQVTALERDVSVSGSGQSTCCATVKNPI